MVVVSGRNGTGKSTLLLAASLLWDAPKDLDSYPLVGPWGPSANIEMTIHLTRSERDALTAAANEQSGESEQCPETVTLGLRFTEYESPARDYDPWSDLLRSKGFKRVNPFAQLTLIPAERSVGRSPLGSVDPDTLSSDSTERIRTEAVESIINKWSNFSLNNIPDYLATLDYTDLITAREGGEAQGESEFDAISDGFLEATGKRIERPTLSREGRVALFVNSFNGNRHSIEQLSSGELEALGLMYMARRLASSGGIMLVDEPEIHLHPSLQTTILEMIRGAGDSSQFWLSTHSPNLINSAPIDSIISVSPARDGANQAARIDRQDARLELLADLGVTPSSWLQHDRIIVVEGSSDKRFIELLFPIEASRSLIYVAGNRKGVDATVRTLADGDEFLPWFAIRDRDLIQHQPPSNPNSFTWYRRAFENVFLEGDLLARSIESAGGEVTATFIEETLRKIASDERGEVEGLLIEEKLQQLVPNRPPAVKGDLKASMSNMIDLQQERIDSFDLAATEVKEYLDANWEAEWKSLVQGKRVLAKFLRYTPFNSVANMTNAICKQCRTSPDLIPDDMARLREMLSMG
ncbi:AAA family ATPase [Streptomyces sp. BE230]|uniref:AAA family ATPase n=1 Tax=Streptomyces sp. BE230 TaxID=3002526 RepID=UPI002ED0ADA9